MIRELQQKAARSPNAVLAIIAALLLLPAALHGPMTHESFGLDTVWTRQFADQLAAGELYPRWLPEAFGGLGAPVFFFYPPSSFYLAAAFHIAGLTVWLSIVAAAWAALWASGMAMRAWTGSQGAALLYMLAPYHLFCFYCRGDLAEFCAYAWTPLIALAIRDRRWVLLAAAYAGLLVTHVPSAVLMSALAIGPFVLWQRDVGVILRAGLSLAAGVALSGCYLVPAVLLQRYASLDSMTWSAFYQPEAWAFWNITHSPSVALLLVVIAFTASAATIAMAVGRSFWSIVGLVGCVCVAGLPIWLLPIFDHLQFPYRALTVVEFALCTALAGRSLPMRQWLVPIPAAMLITFGLVYPNPPLRDMSEADEYLPAGYLETHDVRRFAQIRLPAPIAGQHPVFWFPGWSCAASPTFPAPGSRLVASRDANCKPTRSKTEPERLGAAVSLSAAAALAGIAFFALARRRRAGRA